jgi:eukaryotic-like serine/threonine-protein kinase
VECASCHRSGVEEGRFCPFCGSVIVPVNDTLSGRLIAGRYQVLGLISEGGMGRVYEAEQRIGASTRRVALKTMRPEYADEPTINARFSTECLLLMQLEHPHTVRLLDFGYTEEGMLYLAMELVRGERLTQTMKREGAMALPRALTLLGQIAGALHEAHGKGVVHRDLKPDNIILSRHGGVGDFVKVLDFGIAKHSHAAPGGTSRGGLLGSPAYMSPEQVLGKEVDARADVYSLGLLAYEMLTGRPPFHAENAFEWATQQLSGVPASFDETTAGAQLPAHVKEALLSALSKEPDSRPPGVLEFYAELQGGRATAAVSEPPLSAITKTIPDVDPPPPPIPTPPQASTPMPQPSPASLFWRIMLATVGGALLAAVFLGAGMMIQSSYDEDARQQRACDRWVRAAREGDCVRARDIAASCPKGHSAFSVANKRVIAQCGTAAPSARPSASAASPSASAQPSAAPAKSR